MAIVRIFKHLRFCIILSDTSSLPDINKVYCLDSLSGIENQYELLHNDDIYQLSYRELDIKDLESNIQLVFTGIFEILNERRTAELVDEIIENSGIKKGGEITKEMIGKLSMSAGELFTNDLFRISTEEEIDLFGDEL